MTRLITNGAEMGDTALYATTDGLANVDWGTVAPRSGNRCYRITSGGTARASAINFPSALSEFYLRIAIRVPSMVSGNEWIVQLRNGPNVVASVQKQISTGHFLYNLGTSTTIVEGTVPFAINTWYLMEIHYKVSDTVGVYQVKIDGVLDCNYSGDTKPGADTVVNNFSMNVFNSTLYWDDIALNDTNGTIDNDWCGDGRIVMQLPSSAGDVTQLTRGGTDSGANWSQVDEIPSNGDTDYVESLTAGQYDLYHITTPAALVVGETITRVFVEGRIRETTAAGDSINLGIKSSGVQVWDANMPTTTSYLRYSTSGYIVDPATNLPWTQTSVSGIQIGYKVV